MTKLIHALQKEQEYLEQMKNKTEENLKQGSKNKLPGKLRIQKKGNSVQYYHTYGKNEKSSHSQQSFLSEYPKEGLEAIYNNQNDYRKDLINPIIESDEQYAKIWINIPYVRKIAGDDVPEIFTENGERVRSKSEKMIADKLK